jgi:phosphoglycerate kinase
VKKTIKEVDVTDKRVLVRVDFNVPLEEGAVADDTRIRAALPTIQYLLDRSARLILCSHLGRPGGKVVEELRLDPVAAHLANLLGMDVMKADDCIGPEVEAGVKDLGPGEVLLLENTRFHPGEKANAPDFATQLASIADLYVNDAFGTAHRAHASTEGVAHHLPAVAGLLMERELEALERARENPEHPLIMIFGGAKISDKIGVIERFLQQADAVLVGGGIANTLCKAQGLEIGQSLVEEESLETAGRILDEAGDTLVLPVDVVVADAFDADAQRRTVSVNEVRPGWRILDIGPRTIDLFEEKLSSAKMVVWNGPLGVFEMEPFAEGTFAIARTLAELDAETITGGGETAAAVDQAGVADQMTHVSTGGGAFLTFMEGKELPGIAALDAVGGRAS